MVKTLVAVVIVVAVACQVTAEVQMVEGAVHLVHRVLAQAVAR